MQVGAPIHDAEVRLKSHGITLAYDEERKVGVVFEVLGRCFFSQTRARALIHYDGERRVSSVDVSRFGVGP